jgi:hypothetical protein
MTPDLGRCERPDIFIKLRSVRNLEVIKKYVESQRIK